MKMKVKMRNPLLYSPDSIYPFLSLSEWEEGHPVLALTVHRLQAKPILIILLVWAMKNLQVASYKGLARLNQSEL